MAVNEKYLDHIQAVITRHNSNSFMIKGWTITICTAIFALAGTWKEPILALVALVPITVLWLLDSFYLANERCFVSLYTAAINTYSLKVKNEKLLKEHQEKSEDGQVHPEREVEIKSAEYSMNFMPFRKIARNNWQDVFKSRTIAWFYIMLTAFSIALFVGLIIINKPTSNEPIKISTKIETDSLFIKTSPQTVIINNIIKNDSLIKSDTTKKKHN
jgi:hypothetical protein